jgi:hypothetical protein
VDAELRQASFWRSSETPALKKRLDAIDEQRRVLAYELGGEYPLNYEFGHIGGPLWFGTDPDASIRNRAT